MSWFRRRAGRIACAAGLLALAGCGFHPLYGRGNAQVAPQLGTIKILPMSGQQNQDVARIGQELRNMLYTRLNTKGEPARPKYRLTTVLTETKRSLAVQKTEVATRANLVIDANYKLEDAATGTIVFSAQSRGVASYDIVQSEYANIAAAQDAERRVLQGISDDITLQLSFYFTQEKKAPAPAAEEGAGQPEAGYPAGQAYPAPAYPAPAYPPPGYPAQGYPPYQPPAYQPPAYQPPAYQAPAYQPPAYPAPGYPAQTYPPPAGTGAPQQTAPEPAAGPAP